MGEGLKRARAAALDTQSKSVRLTKVERVFLRHCIRIAREDGSIYGDDSKEAEMDAIAESVIAKLSK